MLRCQPVGNACQTVEQEHLVMSPSYWLQAGSDAFYNRILFGGTTKPHTVFAYVSMGIVATDTYLVKYRGENLLLYRQPTPFTTIGDGITDISENSIQAAYDICQWINENIAYQPQATTIETTAAEVMQSRQGVKAFLPATSTDSLWARGRPMPGLKFSTATTGWASTPPTTAASATATSNWPTGAMPATAPSVVACTQVRPVSKPRFTLHYMRYD